MAACTKSTWFSPSSSGRGLTLLVLTVVLFTVLRGSAAAQTVVDPTVLEFDPSADHNVLLSDGRPKVDHYELELRNGATSAVIERISLGKPAVQSDGRIHVNLTSVLGTNLPVGVLYAVTVVAVGPAGSAASTPSNPFSFSALPSTQRRKAPGGSSDDFDGDGRADVTIYRPTTGDWWVAFSSENYTTNAEFQWGLSGDVPLVGDFDGDGRADVTIYRPTTGDWWVAYSAQNYTTNATFQWGLSGDVPLVGDFDGDGRSDLATYRPTTGDWWVAYSSQNYTTNAVFHWGLKGDVPLVADFDGDGRTDLTTYRPTTGDWSVAYSSQNYTTNAMFQWGAAGDVPMILDVDGDGRDEITVYRPTIGYWYTLFSSRQFNRAAFGFFAWGLIGDRPIGKP